MQNAPTMLAQKMMNRQAPYGPIGMVSQNMSGNKKGAAAGGGGGGGSGVIGLKFDTATATAGVAFSNSDTTATNSSGGSIASAKGNATTTIGGTSAWYCEFIVGTTGAMFLGIGPSSFVCNASNRVGVVSGIGYRPDIGQVFGLGGVLFTVATSTIGDVIGFKLNLTASSSTLTILKNGVEIVSSYASTTYIPNSSTAWLPIWSAAATTVAATISNNIYSYAGYTPIGSSVTTVAASASVPAVADGAYDVYTFNASGTFTVASTGAVRALVIAGGGGTNTVGGAGAGGYQEKGIVATPQTYTITVGAGGSTLVGSNSSIAAAVVSTGGGVGAPFGTKNGGSGGGAYRDAANNIAAGTGIAGQGFNGGSVTFSGGATAWAEGGGGGAGGLGGNGSITVGGNGGAGLTSSITGTAVARGGGGGAYSFDGVTDYYGTATAGGGSQSGGVNGTANTGGGAGPSGAGGSGVVIIRVRARA